MGNIYAALNIDGISTNRESSSFSVSLRTKTELKTYWLCIPYIKMDKFDF